MEYKEKFLNQIYNMNEQEIDSYLKKVLKSIKKDLEEVPDKQKRDGLNKNEYEGVISIIEENNDKKVAFLSQKMYQKGFQDGVQFLFECLK